MPKIFSVLLIFLLGSVGCQTMPPQPPGNIFSTSSTIPPPGTNSYALNSAPQASLIASTTPPHSGEVRPFTPDIPYSGSQEETEPAVQPFHSNQQAAAPTVAPEAAGSVKVAARSGDEIMIPISAFRTGTGLYSSDSPPSQSPGTASETTYVAPYQQ